MPQVFRIGEYLIYFWSNESEPLEPIHVHVTCGTPSGNDTKIWLTQSGHALLCHNNSQIPTRKLSIIIKTIEARQKEIVEKWCSYFGSIRYYC